MASSQSAGVKARPVTHERRSNTTVAAFVVGLPLGAAILGVILFGPLQHFAGAPLRQPPGRGRRSHHVLLCARGPRRQAVVLPGANGPPAGWKSCLPGTARPCRWRRGASCSPRLGKLPRRLQNTYIVNRAAAVLDFLCSRGSADELDDQLRSLADNDAIALEGSYSLIRFITWAMPILGFLGTVLGITQSISGVTPEKLEHDLNQVTDGLALAFDTTALALALTMITMFFSFIVDRAEQGVLESVDRFADRQLAHRFERTGADGGEFVEVVRQNTQVLLEATEGLVQRQVDLWARRMEQADQSPRRGRTAAAGTAQRRPRGGPGTHAPQPRPAPGRAGKAGGGPERQPRWNSWPSWRPRCVRRHASSRRRCWKSRNRWAAQAQVLGRLQEGEKQLIRLQEALNQNLTALAGAGSFEQAVQSLTAAVHLLTARAVRAADGRREPARAPAGSGRMRRRRQALQVSTFPFLAVLLCAMGSLILLLLVMDRRAKAVALAKAQQAVSHGRGAGGPGGGGARRRVGTPAAGPARARWPVKIRCWRRRFRPSSAICTRPPPASAPSSAEYRELQSRLRTRAEQPGSDRGGNGAGDRRRRPRPSKQSEASRAEMARMTGRLAATRADPGRPEAGPAARPADLLAHPLQGQAGRQPPAAVRGVYGDRADLPPGPPGVAGASISAADIRTEVERQDRTAARDDPRRAAASADKTPYLLLLVRPDGITSYYQTLAALRGIDIDFGYEFIEPRLGARFPGGR